MEVSMKVNVACIQMKPVFCDKKKNVERMCDFIDKTMETYPNTQLIVFPELVTTGYECEDKFEILAENIYDEDAFSVKIIREYARKYIVHIIYGFAEKCEEVSKLYNSQILIDGQGEILGTYQKVHLFDTEKIWFYPGDKYQVFDTAIGKLGLFICYDASFPEVARILALKGADILVNSTNWEKPSVTDMDMIMSARALDNTTFLVCCNRVGIEKKLDFFGHSRIIDPLGRVVKKQDNEIEDIVHGELDFDYMEQVRNNYYTMLKERRPDTYGLLIDKEI
jgi:predicted amidohydrolase